MGQVTKLLAALADGRPQAFDALYSLLYPELRRLAHARIRRSGELTLLNTTALVNEAYLRFEKAGDLTFADRAQFMAYAARIMRSIVVDAIRRRRADRHGGGAAHLPLDEAGDLPDTASRLDSEVLRVHESLAELAVIDARLVQVVEMRYFAGLTEAEIAGVLNIGVRTVSRDWEKARLFLHECLR